MYGVLGEIGVPAEAHQEYGFMECARIEPASDEYTVSISLYLRSVCTAASQ